MTGNDNAPRRSTGRRGGAWLVLVDEFMAAGIVGGLVYLVLLHLAGTSTPIAAVAGVVTLVLVFAGQVAARYRPSRREG